LDLTVRAYFEGPEPDFKLFEFVRDLATSSPLAAIGGQLPELLDKAVAFGKAPDEQS
jgi:hypothetical protein